MLKKAVFLDRDGVLNKDFGYVHKIRDIKWVDGAIDTIKLFNKLNYLVFVVTNQSGIAKGLYSEKDVNLLHNYINSELQIISAHIDEFFFSPFHPDNSKEYLHLSHLRKPEIGMLELAESKWAIDKSKSFLIGDKSSDIECAENFSIRGHLFKKGNLLNFIKSSENF